MSLVEQLTRRLEQLVVEKHHLEQKVVLLQKKELTNVCSIKDIQTHFTVIARLN